MVSHLFFHGRWNEDGRYAASTVDSARLNLLVRRSFDDDLAGPGSARIRRQDAAIVFDGGRHRLRLDPIRIFDDGRRFRVGSRAERRLSVHPLKHGFFLFDAHHLSQFFLVELDVGH